MAVLWVCCSWARFLLFHPCLGHRRIWWCCQGMVQERRGSTSSEWLWSCKIGFWEIPRIGTWEQGLDLNLQIIGITVKFQAAKNKVVICQQRVKAQKEREKKTFANMFDKFAEIDKKKEELEKQKRPDAMNNIDQWNRYVVIFRIIWLMLKNYFQWGRLWNCQWSEQHKSWWRCEYESWY